MAYTVTAADLVAGFSDAEGDTLSVANLTASNGVVTYDAVSSTYTITPTADFNGAVTLTYDVTDGNGGSLTEQTQSYTLAPVNMGASALWRWGSALDYTENGAQHRSQSASKATSSLSTRRPRATNLRRA